MTQPTGNFKFGINGEQCNKRSDDTEYIAYYADLISAVHTFYHNNESEKPALIPSFLALPPPPDTGGCLTLAAIPNLHEVFLTM